MGVRQCFVPCPFYTVVWVGWYFCLVSFLHCVVGWSVFVFYVPSTLCCGLVCVLCSVSFPHCVVGQCLCSVSLLHCDVGWFVFRVPSILC